MTVDRINEITQKTAGHYARVIDLVGCGREADLPFPRELTELAYLKGIVICTDDEKHRALLISMYSTLEDIMLTNDEYAIMVEYNAMIRKSGDKEWMENITDKDLAAFMDLGPGGCFPFGIRTRVGLIEGRSNAGRRPCSILHIPAMQTDRYCRDIRVAGLLMIT